MTVPDPTPDPIEAYSWLHDLNLSVIETAVSAHLDVDRAAGDEQLRAALARWVETVDERSAGSGAEIHRAFLSLGIGLAGIAAAFAPDDLRPDQRGGDGLDGKIVVAVESRLTGHLDVDPDVEDVIDGATSMQQREEGAGLHAGVAVLAHVLNGENDRAAETLNELAARFGARAMLAAIWVLAGYAGAHTARHSYETGQLTDDLRASYEARAAVNEAEAAVADAEPVLSHEEAAALSPYGSAVYGLGFYFPGRQGIEDSAQAAMTLLTRRAPDGYPLCGRFHYEAVEVWQLPDKVRAMVRRDLRKFRKANGRAEVLRVWMHTDDCDRPDDPPFTPTARDELAHATETAEETR